MTKLELNKIRAEIIKANGKPEYELNQPMNESARKLVELKKSYLREKAEIEKTKELIKQVDLIDVVPTENEGLGYIPEEIVNEGWLTPFNQEQKKIVKQWLTNIYQPDAEIAQATGLAIALVRATKALEPFKYLRRNLPYALKPILPLEAMLKARALMKSKFDNISFNAAKMVLIDAGLFKGESLDITEHKSKEIELDAAALEKTRKEANEIMDIQENE